MISEEWFKHLTKEQIIDFFGLTVDKNHVNKTFLIGHAIERLTHNEVLVQDLHRTFSKEFSLSPYGCEQLLQITSKERKRWTKEGKLKVVDYYSIEKYGKTLQCPRYERLCLENLSAEVIQQWREDYDKQKKERQREGGKKATLSRLKNQQLRDNFAKEWKETLSCWHREGRGYLATCFELAYWTMWLSRWAKEHHRKSMTALKYSEEYRFTEKKYYAMKNDAVNIFSQTPFASVFFYRPEYPDKWHVHFCSFHFEEFADSRNSWGIDKWTFFFENQERLILCKDCAITVEKDYFSLYLIKVENPSIPHYRFSFHTPYPVGKDFLPSPENLMIANHKEQIDSMFRFGRPVFDEEKIIYREKEVMQQWEEAFKKINYLINMNEDGPRSWIP